MCERRFLRVFREAERPIFPKGLWDGEVWEFVVTGGFFVVYLLPDLNVCCLKPSVDLGQMATSCKKEEVETHKGLQDQKVTAKASFQKNHSFASASLSFLYREFFIGRVELGTLAVIPFLFSPAVALKAKRETLPSSMRSRFPAFMGKGVAHASSPAARGFKLFETSEDDAMESSLSFILPNLSLHESFQTLFKTFLIPWKSNPKSVKPRAKIDAVLADRAFS